ncbi:MAG: LCP family protein [Lagierella massiliensis]|nr:LCP family protein [Lagierella massiliensis]
MNRKSISIIMGLLSLVSIVVFSAVIMINNLLPNTYKIVLIGILMLIFLLAVFLCSSKNSKTKLIIGVFIHLVLIISTLASSYYIVKSIKALDKISNAGKKQEIKSDLSLIKLKTKELKTILENETLAVQTVETEDREKLDSFIDKIEKNLESKIKEDQVESYMTLADNLLEEKTDLIILNEAFRSTINDYISEFDEKTEVIESKSFKDFVNQKKEKIGESFNIYISGIDTYGPIQTVSRSDVNLIASVNPIDRKILLTTIPRDTYIPIYGGGNGQKDKLTHSGIYGIDSSVETIEKFMDLKIDYYVKVNFNTLIDMVDVLGGIEVENLEAFSNRGYDFPKGKIVLDGKKALVFARERYNLKDGDRERGRNQERILKAMIEKMTRPENLLRADKMLEIIEKSAVTNMPKDFMIKQINQEIIYEGKYQIDMIDVKGTGKMGLSSYAMPGFNLYMMVPNEDSVNESRMKIQEVLKVSSTN